MKTLLFAALLAGAAHAQQTPQDAVRTVQQMEYRTMLCMDGAASQMVRVKAPQEVAVRFVLRQCSGAYVAVLRGYNVSEAAARSHVEQMAERAVRYVYF